MTHEHRSRVNSEHQQEWLQNQMKPKQNKKPTSLDKVTEDFYITTLDVQFLVIINWGVNNIKAIFL